MRFMTGKRAKRLHPIPAPGTRVASEREELDDADEEDLIRESEGLTICELEYVSPD